MNSIDLRAELDRMVRDDLHGPAGGPDEELTEGRVSDRYVVGLLAPRSLLIEPEEHDELAQGGSESGDDGQPDSEMPKSASLMPSSIGLTFSVDGSNSEILCDAHWGHYRKGASQELEGADGKPLRVWHRRAAGGSGHAIKLEPGPIEGWIPDAEQAQVQVRGLCRQRDGVWLVTLFLVNEQEDPDSNRDEAWLFQPELRVRGVNGGACFIRRPLPADLSTPPEDRAMEMLYRRDVEFAVGHGAAVHAELVPGRWDCARSIETRIMPEYEVEVMDPPTEEEIPALAEVEFDMKQLADLEQGAFAEALRGLAKAYGGWIEGREAQLLEQAEELESFRDVAQESLSLCREALERIETGIALLDNEPQAAEAFRFANRAMYLQRLHSSFAERVRRGEAPDLEALDRPSNHSWRPFQLAFVLLNLPALVDPLHATRNERADLLWFPTGGGKTEAYLGVAAFAMGIRRLQPDLGGYSSQAGVTVLMRYTLRLLTLQQFQRATALIAACEIIRREAPERWGAEPFRIGLWVGQRSTPNSTKDSAEAIKNLHGDSYNAGSGGSPVQLTSCPWCGQPIDPTKHIKVETYKSGRARTFQYCGDKLGRCPFSRKQAPEEGLPIVVVDEEIYRLLPSLLIATVDKFAQMPWKGATQMLFGRVTGRCERHGFRSPEVEDADSHPARANYGMPAAKSHPAGPLRPPDLIIQDELHLISGPLGTLVGLYETAVDQLCSWELDGQRVRPKVIASTATIRRAQQQVNNLFARHLRVFPPSGLDAQDNFFAKRRPSSPDRPGRLYVGVCAPGFRLKSILIRVYVAYMSAAQKLYDEHGEQADPWMTLVGYFNSMRELGSMRRMADDDVRERLRRMDSRGLARRSISAHSVDELTSRKGASDIPKILDRLETRFVPRGKAGEGKLRYPLDILLATNMISVGVDVSRLGLIVAAGQPKATAEYIQATSRVGRRFPGLVCTVFNWARPRDLSHYERFEHYHATFYRQVEALSITPFATRALDRGLAGVAVSLVRLADETFNANASAGNLRLPEPSVDRAIETIADRADWVTGEAAIVTTVRNRLRVLYEDWASEASQIQGAILGYQGKKDGKTVPLLDNPSENDWDTFTCLNSLRDVEPQVHLVLWDSSAEHEPAWLYTKEAGDSKS